MQSKIPNTITWEEREFLRLSNFFFVGLVANIVISFSMIIWFYLSKEINTSVSIFFGSFFAAFGFFSILLMAIYKSNYKRITRNIAFFDKPKNAA